MVAPGRLSPSTPSLAAALEDFVKYHLRSSKNVLFGRIDSYDATTRSAIVTPDLWENLWSTRTIEFPKLENVPVVFPSSKKLKFTWKLVEGDPVILLFSDRSMADWLDQGNRVPPQDPRQNDITDAIAIPGLFPFSEVEPGETEDMALVYEGATISIDSDGKLYLNSPDEIELISNAALKLTAQDNVDIVSVAGSFKVTVTPGAGKVSMGNGVVEVVKVLSDTLAQLAITTVPTALGPQPLLTAAQFVTLKASLDQLLET